MTAPRETATPVRPGEEAPVLGPREEGPVAPGPREEGPVAPGPREEGPVAPGPREEGPRGSGPREEAPPARPTEEPAPSAERPPGSEPWEQGSRPRRYAAYRRQLARTNPGAEPLTPEQWWRETGYQRYLRGLQRRGSSERPLSREQWWEQFGSKPARNPYGGPGDPEHQAVVSDLRARAEAAYPPPRYRVTSNQEVPTPSGYRKPDVAVIDTSTGRVVRVYEAARFNNSGGFEQPYEAPKIADYEALGIPYEFHPVGPNQPPGGVLTTPPPAR